MIRKLYNIVNASKIIGISRQRLSRMIKENNFDAYEYDKKTRGKYDLVVTEFDLEKFKEINK